MVYFTFGDIMKIRSVSQCSRVAKEGWVLEENHWVMETTCSSFISSAATVKVIAVKRLYGA